MIKQSIQERFKLDDEVMKISRICLVVFFSFIGFGVFAPTSELGLYDPTWIRILHASITLGFSLPPMFPIGSVNKSKPSCYFSFIP